MKISFVQSGGFSGLVKGCEIDTVTVSPAKASEIDQIVKASNLLTSGEFLSDLGRDLQQYEITIENKGSRIEVTFDDETIPASAKPLIGYLKKCSQPKQP